MKTVHHVIAAAIDAGIPEADAEKIGLDLYESGQPLAMLDTRISALESQMGELRKTLEALRAIRVKWGAFNAEPGRVYRNGEDRIPGTLA